MNKSEFVISKIDEMEAKMAEQNADDQEQEDVEEGRKLKAAGLAAAAGAGGAAMYHKDKIKQHLGMGDGGGDKQKNLARLARQHGVGSKPSHLLRYAGKIGKK